MGTKYDFNKKLKDTRWNEVRKQILNRDNYTCLNCSQDAIPLHVHHTYYDFDLNPWEYDHNSLITLCENCHRDHHQSDKALNKLLIDAINKCGFDKYCKLMLISAFEAKADELREAGQLIDRFFIHRLCYGMFEPGESALHDRFHDLLIKKVTPSIFENLFELKYAQIRKDSEDIING